MPNSYIPKSPADATDQQLLNDLASDLGFRCAELDRLSVGDRARVVVALRSLAIWIREPIPYDTGNPFWLQDEGYSDAEEDTKTLNEIAAILSNGI